MGIPTMLEAWADDGRAPFSFELGGQTAQPRFRRVRRSEDERKRKAEYVYEVPGHDITLTLDTEYTPGADLLTYQLRMRADRSLADAVSNVRVIDWQLEASGDDPYALRGFNGGCVRFGDTPDEPHYPRREFRIWDDDLDEPFEASETEDGRCSREYLPIWFLHGREAGVWFGAEWSGTWALRVAREAPGATVALSLPFTHFVLYQGEEVVFPPVTLGTWQGDVREGCLSFRRTLRDELMPRMDGEVPDPPVALQVLTGLCRELDADGLEREIDLCEEVGVESYVWASSWMREVEAWTHFPEHRDWAVARPGVEGSQFMNWWEFNGHFVPVESRFPEGIESFSEDLAERGMLHGLWYDPRVNMLVDEYEECQDALVPYKKLNPRDKIWDMGLIDLGRESGRRYMLSLIERFVEQYGAGWIWHDLNVEVRERYWDNVEEPDRRGLMELRYNEGMHRVYEEVLERWPDVWIEWCASGGTMIDLGTLRRSHTLWVADYTDKAPAGTTDASRAYRSCLNWIFPATYIYNTFYAHDPIGPEGKGDLEPGEGYGVELRDLLTQFASPFGLGQSLIKWDGEDIDLLKQVVAVYKDVRHYLNKEFWGLFEPVRALDEWDGWQFHDPGDGSGILVLFKNTECTHDTEPLDVRWVDPDEMDLEVLLGEAEIVPEREALRVTLAGNAALIHYTTA